MEKTEHALLFTSILVAGSKAIISKEHNYDIRVFTREKKNIHICLDFVILGCISSL